MYDVSVTTMPVDELDGVHVTTESKNHSTTGKIIEVFLERLC